MDNNKKIDPLKLHRILEAIRFSPSSLGLQPFYVLVVQDEAIRQRLRPACFNQPQITECDTLLVFIARKKISEQYINNYISSISTIRNVDKIELSDFKNMITDSIPPDSANVYSWTKQQTYLALGFALMACSLEQIDSTPMEGFEQEKVNTILGIDSTEESSSVLLSLGYRDEQKDTLFDKKKVRKSSEELFKYI